MKPDHKILGTLGLSILALAAGTARADAPADSGEHTYSITCQACHMPEGQGAEGAGFYPKLAKNPTLASWQYVAVTVLNGRHGMPGFGTTPGAPGMPPMAGRGGRSSSLSDAQVADVVNYVRTHFGNKFKDKATAQGVATLPHPGGPGSTDRPG